MCDTATPSVANTRFAYDLPPDYETAKARGLLAATRLTTGAALIDWLDVAAFLNEGAKRAKAEADNNDKSKAYKQAYSRWLKAHPELEAVSGPERAAAIWCLKEENWPKACDYLHTLTANQMVKVTMRTVKRHVEPAKDPVDPDAPKKETKTEALIRENEALNEQLAQRSRPALDLREVEFQLRDFPDDKLKALQKAIDAELDARAKPLGRGTRPKTKADPPKVPKPKTKAKAKSAPISPVASPA
jgi:hypothetical protein